MKTEEGRIKSKTNGPRDGFASASPSATSHVSLLTSYLHYFIALGLLLLTLAVFWPVGGNDFVDYDDNINLTENHHVQKGLTIQGVLWALRSTYASNWQPLTWLSQMLDVTFFGMNPAGHHWMSLLFHGMNVLLLFALLRRMTGALWPSAFVVALFAIHPLHVESVAWLAERKDVLSTFFGLLALWAYAGYVEKRVGGKSLEVGGARLEAVTSNLKPRTFNYLGVLLFFTLGLMAKPMLVTLPFLMLLLDYWPLGRLEVKGWRLEVRGLKPQTSNVFLEKLPFFFLVIASSVITFWAQQKGRSVLTLEQIPIGLRIENALVSYVSYLGRMLWPHNLAISYPHPLDTLNIWRVFGAGLVLIAISVWVILNVRRRPYLFVGWLWYLGTLVPVIGIVQVGTQAMADRYTYIPLIGIFIMIAWGAEEGLRSKVGGLRQLPPPFRLQPLTPFLAAIVLVLLAVAARVQVGYWKNSTSLFEHAIEAVPGNYFAYNGLGLVREEQGKLDEAIALYQRAIALNPGDPRVRSNLGNTLAGQGKFEEAMNHYREAITIDPHFAKAHTYLGIVLAQQGRFEEAIDHYTEAIRINPDYFEAQNDLGLALAKDGKIGEAIIHFIEAIRINPDKVDGHYNLAGILALQGRLQEAAAHLSEAIRIKPDDFQAHYNLGIVDEKLNRSKEAIGEFQTALRINPGFSAAREKLSEVKR